MSAAANKWLVERIADVPVRALKVLTLLAWHHNGKTGQCNPSHELLAKELGRSTRTVRRAIAELREAELVRTYQRSKGGDRWETMAYVLVPRGGTVPEQWRPPGAKRTPSKPPDNKLSAGRRPDHRTDSNHSVPTTTGHTGGHLTGKNCGGVSGAAAEPEEGGASALRAPTPPSTKEAGYGEAKGRSTHSPLTPPSFSSNGAAVGTSVPGTCDGIYCAKASEGQGCCAGGCERPGR